MHVIVECANHVGTQYERALNRFVEPNAFVTWPFAREEAAAGGSGASGRDLVQTPVCERDSSPRWYFEAEGRLPCELLQASAPDKCFVLRLWHRPLAALAHSKASSAATGAAEAAVAAAAPPDAESGPQPSDRVIGWVAVDLHPLAFGLQQIAGWYNVLDFVSGHSNAQLKLCVVPLDPHLIRQFKPLLLHPTYSSSAILGAARRPEPKARGGDEEAVVRADAGDARKPKANDTLGDEAIVRALSVPALPLALLPPRHQSQTTSTAAAQARSGERERHEEADPTQQERALAAGLPVSSEKLELNTLKELLAQNLSDLDQITRQLRNRHLNPNSAVLAAAAATRVPGPTAAYPPLTAAGRALLEQLGSRARAEAALYEAHLANASPIARRTERSSPRRGAAPAGAQFGASASLDFDFDSSAELTRVSSDLELPDPAERSSAHRSPLRPLPAAAAAELNNGASTLRWDDELERSPRSSLRSSPRKHHHNHHHHVQVPTSSPSPTSSGDALIAVASSMVHMLPFLSSQQPVESLAQFPTGTNLTGGSPSHEHRTYTGAAPDEGESGGDGGDGDGDEYDTTESRILNEDPHSLTLTSTLDASFNPPDAPPLHSVPALEADDQQREEPQPRTDEQLVPPEPPAPEANDELETLRELEEARRLKERIERLLTQCAEERAATSARSPRADPPLLNARSSSPPPASVPADLLGSSQPLISTSTSTASASQPPPTIAIPIRTLASIATLTSVGSTSPIVVGSTSPIVTSSSKLVVSDSLAALSKSSPGPGLQPPNSSLPAPQIVTPSISTAPPPLPSPTTTTPITRTTSATLSPSSGQIAGVLPAAASPPPGVPLISATRRRLAEQFDVDLDDGANDDALFMGPSIGDRGASRPGPAAFVQPELRSSRSFAPPPPPASAVAAAVSTARYMEQLSRIEAAIQARSVPRKSPPSAAGPSSNASHSGHSAPSPARQQHQLPPPEVARIENIFYGGSSRPTRTPPRAIPEPSTVSLGHR